MFNVIKKSCPYQNWTSVAKEQCPNPVNFHCLKDEFGRIVWLCSEPIWVKKDECPVFNVGAKKMDSTSCLQTRCPPLTYLSNDIDVGRRQPSKNNGKQEEESLDLMQDTTKETARKEEKPACLFDRAKRLLIQNKMVVITGVPGSDPEEIYRLSHSIYNNTTITMASTLGLAGHILRQMRPTMDE
uniref:Uncharacterized protein n=1 Tax=Magallana gigas TaxID=29159 RepID=A0A8W8LWJ1_MAGGI